MRRERLLHRRCAGIGDDALARRIGYADDRFTVYGQAATAGRPVPGLHETALIMAVAVCVPLALSLPLRAGAEVIGKPGDGGDVVPDAVSQARDGERLARDAGGVQPGVEAGEGVRGA